MMKRCTKCDEFKVLEEFVKDRSRKDGRRNLCKKCKAIVKVKYNKDYKNRYKIKHGVSVAQSYRAKDLGITVEELVKYDETRETIHAIKNKTKEIRIKKQKFKRMIEFENKYYTVRKECTKCNETKEIDEFPIENGKVDGHRANCIVCEKARQKEKVERLKYTKKNRDYKKRYDKVYRCRPENKERISAHGFNARAKRKAQAKGKIKAKEFRKIWEASGHRCY